MSCSNVAICKFLDELNKRLNRQIPTFDEIAKHYWYVLTDICGAAAKQTAQESLENTKKWILDETTLYLISFALSKYKGIDIQIIVKNGDSVLRAIGEGRDGIAIINHSGAISGINNQGHFEFQELILFKGG